MDTQQTMARTAGSALTAVFVLFGLLNSACATQYTVGGSQGWIELDAASTTSYDAQFRNITLIVNDTLLFPYIRTTHNVYEVSQADLAACNGQNPIATYVDTNTTVTLNRTGYYGFICQIPGHCTVGKMHLAVNVSAAVAPTPAPVPAPSPTPTPAPAPAPGTPSPTPSTPETTPPPSETPGEAPGGESPGGSGANSLASGVLLASAIAGFVVLFV